VNVIAPPPVLDPQGGAAAFAEDLPRVLQLLDASRVEDLGWLRLNSLTLLVPMSGQRGEVPEEYLLKLGFQAYRRWPPSAQFVNPETLAFDPEQDSRWLPRLTSNECQTHLRYPHPSGGTIQLVCCSATLEFYDVGHNVEEEHLWSGKSTFYSTIVAIQRAFSESYQGSFGA